MNDDFFDSIYDVVRQIPYGRVSTYGAIAAFLGTKRAARMVGWALNKSFAETPFVPAHRVVNRNGELTGKNHFPQADMMQQLLENEGIKVENDRVLNFKQLFWNPATLLR